MNPAHVSEQALSSPDVGIKDYLEILRRRKAVFIQVFVLVLIIGIVVTALSFAWVW